jgi:hypothetical protein
MAPTLAKCEAPLTLGVPASTTSCWARTRDAEVAMIEASGARGMLGSEVWMAHMDAITCLPVLHGVLMGKSPYYVNPIVPTPATIAACGRNDRR